MHQISAKSSTIVASHIWFRAVSHIKNSDRRRCDPSSITLEEFHQMAGYDYVLEQGKESYYDPNHTEHLSQQLTFDEFLQRQRYEYRKPLGL